MGTTWRIVFLSGAALLAGCGGAPEKKPAQTAPPAAAPAKTPACDCEGSGTEKPSAPSKPEDAKPEEKKSEDAKPEKKKSEPAEKPAA